MALGPDRDTVELTIKPLSSHLLTGELNPLINYLQTPCVDAKATDLQASDPARSSFCVTRSHSGGVYFFVIDPLLPRAAVPGGRGGGRRSAAHLRRRRGGG
eukprot:6892106-Pyramimonas_sp.AAC.1